MTRWAHAAVPLVVVFFLFLLRFLDPPLIEDIRFKVFDTYQRLNPRIYRQSPVKILDIDEESLKHLGQWPWPRTQLAQLVKRLHQAGALAIIFDVIFPEFDRTSPQNVVPLWQVPPVLRDAQNKFIRLPDHDALFAAAVAESRVVSGFALISEKNGSAPDIKTEFVFVGNNPSRYLPWFGGAVVNIAPLEEASLANGCINTIQERDGVIRRVPLMFKLEDKIFPSLVTGALSVYKGGETFVIRHSGDGGESSLFEREGIASLESDSFSIPVDEQGRMWLYDTGHIPGRFIPAWKVLQEALPDSELKGKIVFIGTTAVGLKDIRITPLNSVAAGVEAHAQLVEQILHNEFLIQPDWAFAAETSYFIVSSLLLIFLMPYLGAAGSALFSLSGMAGAFALCWWGFVRRHWLLDPLFPSAGLLMAYLLSLLIHFWKAEVEKRQIRSAFSRYLSPAVVEQLARHPEKLKLGGEMKKMSVLFLDIRDFTAISERFDAQGLTRFINRFLTPMTDIILAHQGTIDKYMGDCIMAFWNAPLDDSRHAANACQAAVAMRNHLLEWNVQLRREAQAEGKPFSPVHMGIGINTGECCVGNMGSDRRFDYSVIGDPVNLASRLEGQCKAYRVDIIISEYTYEQIEDFATFELDLIQVKGKTKPVRIFGIRGGKEIKERPDYQALLSCHKKMLEAYRSQNFGQARKLLEECQALDTPKTRMAVLYKVYKDRIDYYEANPPGPGWNSVYVATSK